MALPEFTHDMEIIRKLSDYPNDSDGLTAEELKEKFDEAGMSIAEYLNGVLLPALFAKNLKFTSSENIPKSNIQDAIESVYASIQNATVGQLPNSTVSMAKLAEDVTELLQKLQDNDSTFSDDVSDINQALAETNTEVDTKQKKLEGESGQIVIFDSDGNVVSRFTVDSIDAVSGNMANVLLSEAHAGRATDYKQDVLLGLFKDKNDVQSLSQLRCSNGAYVLSAGGSITVAQNYNDGGHSYPRKSIIAASGDTTLATLSASGYFTTSKITIKYTMGGCAVKFGLYQGGVLLGESAENAITSKSDQTELSIPIIGTISPNESCELRATATGSGTGVYVWEMSVDADEVLYTAGNVVTLPESFSAKRMLLFMKWGGTLPTVSYSVGEGEFTMIPLDNQKDTKTYDGSSCKLSTAVVVLPEGSRSGTMRFKFELTGAGSAVYDYCVSLLQQ